MKNSKTDKKSIFQWAVTIAILAILYFTGLHTEVIGGFQRMLLGTGILKPETNIPTTEREEKEIMDVHSYFYDLTLITIDGRESNLRELEGKVVFLNIWATWCPPCIAEMPNIHSLYKKTDPSKIAFVMLSLDNDHQKAKNFIQRKSYNFPVYFPGGTIPDDLQVNVVPTTFILDKKGKIITRHEGMADYDNEDFRNYLKAVSEPVSEKQF